MNAVEINFEDVLEICNVDLRKKSGNLKCPFCQVQSFKIYPEQKANCHNLACKWHGDAIQFYGDYKNISRAEAFKELAEKLKIGELKFSKKTLTYAEALEAFSKDLEFLAWCRMYFAFYGNKRVNQQIYAEKANLSQSAFNKILNGNLGNLITWKKTLNVLKTELRIEQFKKDLKIGNQYFKNDIDTDAVKKYMKCK